MAEYMITKADVGGWLNGSFGWHNNYEVVELAIAYGFQFDAETAEDDRAALDLYKANDVSAPGYDDAWEVVCGQNGLCAAATEYLESLAEPGLHFEWGDGLVLTTCDQIEGHDPTDCL